MKLNTIIQGDCLEVTKTFSDKSVDIIITDPPYGINIGGSGRIGGSKRIGGSGIVKPTQYTPVEWDNKGLSLEQWNEIKRISKNQIIFGYNYFAEIMGNCRGIIVWDKKIKNDWNDNFSDCEILYTSFNKPAKMFRYLWMGALRGKQYDEQKRFHPTQKPLALMKWIIQNYTKETDLVLDCFLGSGTTIVACKHYGRKYIGIEILPEYCKIANERLAQEVLF